MQNRTLWYYIAYVNWFISYWLESTQIKCRFLQNFPLGFLLLHTSNLACHPGSFFCQIQISRYPGPSDTLRLAKSSELPSRYSASKWKLTQNGKSPFRMSHLRKKAIEFISLGQIFHQIKDTVQIVNLRDNCLTFF